MPGLGPLSYSPCWPRRLCEGMERRMTSILARTDPRGARRRGAGAARAELEVRIAYLEAAVERPPTLSNLDPVPEDLGLAGAEIGLKDNMTTGSFLGHELRARRGGGDPRRGRARRRPGGARRDAASGGQRARRHAACDRRPARGRGRGDLQRHRAGRAAARRRLPRQRAAHHRQLRHARRRADAVPDLEALARARHAGRPQPAGRRVRRGAAPVRRQVRAGDRRREGLVLRRPTCAAAPRRRCRRSPRTSATTTCCSWPTRSATSASTCSTTPGRRGRSPAPRACAREPGRARSSNGAPCSCRTASRAMPTATCAPRTTAPGRRCARSARR